MSKKGENIYKRKDGRWEGRFIQYYIANGKAKYGYIYGKTYNEVKQKLIYKKSTHFKQRAQMKSQKILYDDILNMWLYSIKIKIKESTYARYTHLIETHIRKHLGKYPISKISTQLIEEFINKQLKNGRLKDGGALSPKTVTDILTIIKSSIEYAKYNNFIVICNLNQLSIKKKEKKMRVLSLLEQKALVNVLLNEMDLYKFGVLLSLYTGIRIGELCALQWEDINITDAVLTIRKTMQRIQNTELEATTKTKIIITEPKSQHSIRDIPLPPFIIEKARLFVGAPKAYILSGKSKKFIEPRTMQNKFKKFITESKIDDANFHCLRHTFATRCVEVGFEIKSLSEILGHANVNITLNRYVHSSFDLKYMNMNKLTLFS